MADSAAQTRKRAAESGFDDRDIRQRLDLTPPVDHSAADLALDHLLFDPLDHPLHQRDLNQILNALCSEEFLHQQIRQPLARVIDEASTREIESSGKLRIVQRQIITGWSERMVRLVGQALGDVVNVNASGEPTWINAEVVNARFELKVTPLLQLDDPSDGGDAAQAKRTYSGLDDETASPTTQHNGQSTVGALDEVRRAEIVLDDGESASESGSTDGGIEIISANPFAARDTASESASESVDYEMLDKNPLPDETAVHDDGGDWPINPPDSWRVQRYSAVGAHDNVLTLDSVNKAAHAVLVAVPAAQILTAIRTTIGGSLDPEITRDGHAEWIIRLPSAFAVESVRNRAVQIC